MVQEALIPTWYDFSLDRETLGFSGWDYTWAGVMDAGMNAIVADAARALAAETAAALGLSDSTLSLSGAFLALALTIVGVVAMGASRLDMEQLTARLVCGKDTTKSLVAMLVVMITVGVGLIMPAVIMFVADSQAGENSVNRVQWV